MFNYIITSALIAAPLVAGHGKVTVFTGDQGGNGTALGIQGGVIANVGQNYQTEPDTTIFWSKDINTDDDFGFTDSSGGNLGMSDLVQAMALSGSTLPQVSVGGSINATLHVVTSDGAGPYTAIVDPTATGKFSAAVDMEVTTQVPGEDGWIDTTPSDAALAAGNGQIIQRWTSRVSRTFGGRIPTRTTPKRQTATLVDKDYNLQIAMPAGTTCTGTANGLSNLCAVKISNNNENGPFGAVLIVQMADSSSSAATEASSTSSAVAAATATASTAAKVASSCKRSSH
ncbi:hypothetical protein BX600DRAFT_57191 [Xylariales sp. PMI_506]|nr:hypothetical protein BX600DRAFT_57191 [Xylariales sp. PMI_506]